MNDTKIYLSGCCPSCGSVLDYSEDDFAVECHGCKNKLPIRLLTPPKSISLLTSREDAEKELADDVTSARAGLIYFNNFCDSYSWKSFALNAELSISAMDAIAEVCKVKFSDDPITYLLDFRRIALPIFKKIESLEVLEVEIIENYKRDDISDLFEYLDLYSSITSAIAEKRESIIETLKKDIRLAEKFGAEEDIINDLNCSLELFIGAVRGIKEARDIESIPGYKKAKELCDARRAGQLAELGIDAALTYQKAENLLSRGLIDAAVHLFHLLGDYKDSKKIIEKHSAFFEFKELYEVAGKRYVIKDKRPLFIAENGRNSQSDLFTFSLYEVNGESISDTPSITEISRIIGCWGTRIYFMRNEESICCFETTSAELYANVKILDEGMRGDYAIDEYHPIRFSSDRSQFFIRKVIHTAKRKKKKRHINRDNNYSVIRVDMDKILCATVIPEIVDIMDFCDDRMFYTFVDRNGIGSFRVWSLSDETSDEILDTGCEIHKVIGTQIIYSVWSPSMYNLDLYSIDIRDKKPILLATNISSYYTAFEGKIFYKIGADGMRLYSVNPDGSDRTEIMSDPGSICALRSGWIYYTVGDDRNTCLLKVSTDGKRQIPVASRFGSLVKMTNGYIYYISSGGDLHVVRNDGNGDTLIAESVSDEEIIVDDKSIYYLKREYIGTEDGDEDGFGFSLYSTDLDGKNLLKLAHNVNAMKDYDDGHIHITYSKLNDYMITIPTSRKAARTEYTTALVTYYESLSKLTGAREAIMCVGTPEKEYGTYKTGWLFFRKKRKAIATVTDITSRATYTREGISSRGYIRNSELEAKRRKRALRKQKKLEKLELKRARKEAKLSAKKKKKEAKILEKKNKKLNKKSKKNSTGADVTTEN